MKKLVIFSVLIVAYLGFASLALAQEASVFGDGVLLRAYLVQTPESNPATYSAYIEVRDENGDILQPADFLVTGLDTTPTPTVTANPFMIHDNDLTSGDISMSYDSVDKTVYIFCTNAAPGLHVMKYVIHKSTPDPIQAVCATASQGLTNPPSPLCAVGDASAVSGSGNPWSWTCSSPNAPGTGYDASCVAYKKVDGVCVTYPNGSPTTPTNLCSAGNVINFTGSGPWNWTCQGLYGGSDAPCSATVQSSSGTPDLLVTGIAVPSALLGSGEPFYLSVSIKNQGSGATNGTFRVTCVWSTSYLYNSSNHHVMDWDITDSIPSGGMLSKTVYVPAQSSSTHGYYYVSCMVDSLRAISESNETNNTRPSGTIRTM